ncbi:hypothetical protein VA7868_03328 [Vibrio aerogenes CECT 7868]|uniref:ParD-like antitoxin of type II bacterial toxin-antitoxin system n=1 Tax=Vibrio aerogenes CECT 7868 TaxID=1216006 RepID=A0A1M5ZWD0_9VIBR|nr:hypothetical protein [Vibrio aerogenes]SHI28478.1 hypothetical protein VA7868_03328 [Vibrio aerogenes CECT 7868]
MATSIWLDNNLVENARAIGQSQSRSAAKQIEHWVYIGRMMEENPNLLKTLIRQTDKEIHQPDTE